MKLRNFSFLQQQNAGGRKMENSAYPEPEGKKRKILQKKMEKSYISAKKCSSTCSHCFFDNPILITPQRRTALRFCPVFLPE
jgi:hypothetical protein